MLDTPSSAHSINLPVYVICMAREADRRHRITQHLNALSVPFQWAEAVDGHQLTAEQRVRYSQAKAEAHQGRALALGELGCYLSHSTVWERMVTDNIQAALIIESDAVLTADTLQAIQQLMNGSVPWELVMLFYRECQPSFWYRQRLNQRCQLVKFANSSACTTAYLLNIAGAKKLLAKAYPIYMPVDDYMTGGHVNKGINTFAVYPRTVQLTADALATSSIRADLFPLLEQAGIQRRLPHENKAHKVLEQRLRRFLKQLLLPPWL